jgi:putative ABC transport system ATP-binding protein
VAIARALAARPAILLADEPTARLDHSNARAVGELLRRLAHETGTAVVCATHDAAVIEEVDAELLLGTPVSRSSGRAATAPGG